MNVNREIRDGVPPFALEQLIFSKLLLKIGALYFNSLSKKGGAASEQLRSDSGAAPEQREAGRSKVEQKKLIKNCPKPKQILRHIFDLITS